ncbi:MAG: hypothetical protein RLZZ352_1956 [Pseudomonadota bacterium]|jgi:hypothetical protein
MTQTIPFFLITALKLVSEIALLALLGRAVLGFILGRHRQVNVIYQLLDRVGQPFLRLIRWISPAVVLDQHISLAACLLLGFAWLALTLAKIQHCLQAGVVVCA